ncbi:MAG: hypothetical protein H6Q67_1693 [Firmicutes bacterium]|nr:hypothetical protein [Bacillota bacterium]
MVVGRKNEAMEAYKKCIEVDPTSDLAVLARKNLKKVGITN